MRRGRIQSHGALVLVVLACLVTPVALVVGYVQRAAVNSDQFANRATDALQDSNVRDLIAARVTDQVVLANSGDLIAARPLIQSAVSSVIGGPAFTGLFRAAVRDVHRAVFDRDQHTVTLTLKDIGAVLAGVLQAVHPQLAAKLDAGRDVDVLNRDFGGASASALRVAKAVSVLAVVLLVLAIGLTAVAMFVSTDRRRTAQQLGIGLVGGGVLLVVLLGVTRSLAVNHAGTADARAAAGAIWDAFLGDLQTAAWLLAIVGALVAAVASSLLRPFDLSAPLRRVWAILRTEPARPALRVARGLLFIVVGLLFIIDPGVMLELLFVALGVYLVHVGANAILTLIYRPPEATTDRPVIERRRRRRRFVSVVLVGALTVGLIGAFVGSGAVTVAAPPPGVCEGHASLCDKSLDAVALPATHNSMSVPLPGWYSSQQDRPIPEQLSAGIRGLLIDTYYADRLSNGRLRTVIPDEKQQAAKAKADGISQSTIDAALRLRERLGFSGSGTRGMYLCHGFCEIGGTPLSTVLRQLHDFLVANPNQIVVVINQDYVTPQDFVDAVKEADLGPLAYSGPTAAPWPTLRAMINDGQRVVFLAENHAGAAPWYHPAYKSILQETPYSFSRPAQLTDPKQIPASCRENRGPPGAPLFLLNHWITTDPVPLPSDAVKVNAYNPFLRRAEECERIRHHIANLVAVNFYRRGNVFKVVDTLNGIK